MDYFDIFKNNAEWVIATLTFIGSIISFIVYKKWKRPNGPLATQEGQSSTQLTQSPVQNNSIIINNSNSSSPPIGNIPEDSHMTSLDAQKNLTKILFIDDDSKFKVVQILKNSGWLHTSTIKDVRSLDCDDVRNAHIFFVDIQGVGHLLGFEDEGLGLADALKRKYPLKKTVIYSAETKGDRFHKALRNVDSFLAKNADPYEFQQLVEEYSAEIAKNGY
ncbi:hypothetical protein [Aquirhabdus parva]|uniref:Response regulator n=1 Tax=Aquirhabdus parva TaxID=2283318 RepID=A0A345P9P0_9GAMM|nr:hypothetical protein [Aquirhabdus parva]AXI03999.1 hypothetical protein HYN46_14800 [Aquirhabdus parva]